MTPYARCPACLKVVRVNKPMLGSLHVCLTVCEVRGHHSTRYAAKVRRVGPFWRRRTELCCGDCDQLIETEWT